MPAIIEPNNQEAIVRGDNSSAPLIDFVRGIEKYNLDFVSIPVEKEVYFHLEF